MAFSITQNVVAVSATASSVAVQISATDSVATATQCLVSNTSASLYVGVLFGKTGLAAVLPVSTTAGGHAGCHAVIPPMSSVVLGVPAGTTYAAAIGSAAGPTYVSFAFGKEG
jgi:hypothetical protein